MICCGSKTSAFQSVLWTVLGSQLGFGLLVGVSFFLLTFGAIRYAFNKTSHLPVLLSDAARREVPLLDLLASNLKPLTYLAPLVISVMVGLIMTDQWDVPLKFLNGVDFGSADPIFQQGLRFSICSRCRSGCWSNPFCGPP